MKKLLRLTCFYCDNRIAVDFYEMRKSETAHEELRRHDWIFGAMKSDRPDVLFDPLCTECGRGVVQQMLDAAVPIDPEAMKAFRRIYPDLFEDTH